MESERYASLEKTRAYGLLVALLLALVLAIPLSLTGCSGEEANVRSSLEDALAAVRQCDETALDDLFGSVWFYPEDYGVSSTCFAEAYFGDLMYEMGDVQVKDGNAASIELTVSAYRMSDVLSVMEAARDEAAASGVDFLSEGYADAVFSEMAEEAQWDSDELSMSVELECADDGAWMVSNEAMLAAVLLDGYDPRQAEL